MTQPRPAPALRLRILLDPGNWIGPGKADLLAAIARTGSIAAAGRSMGMSYKRAWQLIDTLNQYFAMPLVQASKGGQRGGGAELTAFGFDVLKLYRSIARKANKAAALELRALARLPRR